MGTPKFAYPILEALDKEYNVVMVVSQPDREKDRKGNIIYPPCKEYALSNNIEVFQPLHIKDEYKEVLDKNPDIIITCAYGQIIPEEILKYPKYGCINVHGSLLPKLRGGAPIHHAIINGYSKTGITIMYMDVGMDDGDIISQEETDILDSDNLESLHDRLSLMGRDLLLDTLPSIIEGTNRRIKQDPNEVTFAYNIKREEEHIDFTKSAREVFNLIRGLSPIPGANAIIFDNEMKILGCQLLDKKYNASCGEIVETTKEGFVVACGDGAVLITEVKPYGKNRMTASSYVNGNRDKDIIGKVFQ